MIYLGADHGGFDLKEKVKKWLTQWEYQWEDLGNTIYDKEDDYPEYAFAVAKKVAEHPRARGVLLCRSAGGVIIAANKVKGVRAVNVFDSTSAKHAVEHNNANVIGLSGDWLEDRDAKKTLKAYLEAEFTGEERHGRRIKQIEEFEAHHLKLTS